MKRFSMIALLLALGLLLTGVLPALAKGGPGGPGRHGGPGWRQDDRLRDDAREVLQRTSRVLRAAQDAASRSRRYDRRGLGQAFGQQRYAQDEYRKRDYRDAIYHSLRARELAMEILRRNRGRMDRGWDFDDRERRYRRDAPSDRDLDTKIRGFIIGDDDATHFSIEFNF